MFYKRTLILSDVNDINSVKKGVVTLESCEKGIKGQLRLYNFLEKPQNLAIGIASGGEVFKVPITPIDNIIEFKLEKKINLQEKLSCGLVDLSKVMHPKMIIGGTSNYLNDWADRVEQAFVSDTKILNREDMYSTSVEEIEKEIETVLRQDKEFKDCDICQKCKYKQAFFESKQQEKIEQKPNNNIQKIEEILALATNSNEEDQKTTIEYNAETQDEEKQNIEEDVENENKLETDFYSQIKDQIDELFKNHSRDESLERILPNSKWVRVEYDDMPGHYVMGLIYEDNVLQFISYGLPAQNNQDPPKDLIEFAQWLPTTQNVDGEGYWLVYQSAKSGESVKIKER